MPNLQVIDGEMFIAGEFEGFMEFNKMVKVWHQLVILASHNRQHVPQGSCLKASF